MDPFCYLCFMLVSHTVLSVPCSLVVTCWERANLLVLLYVMFSCVFVTNLGQLWYLIVLIPDLCLLPYLYCRFSLIFIGLDNIILSVKTRNIFITQSPISVTNVLSAQKTISLRSLGSFEYQQCMFWLKNKKNNFSITQSYLRGPLKREFFIFLNH